MIKSMTGFGRGKYENEGRTYTVEIKSVNHKYSDINVRLPRFLNNVEDKIRKRVAEVISRGKIDIFVSFENYSNKGTTIRINKDLAKEYIRELRELADEADLKFDLNVIDVSKFPEILKLEDEDNDELIGQEVMIALNDALGKFVSMREVEGKKLVEDIERRIYLIQEKVNEVTKFSSTLVEEYMARLQTRVNELLAPGVVDEARLMQEIVIFSDKSSIEEELTRLKSHISQFLELIKQSSPIGKKIDFLIQEINREVNIGNNNLFQQGGLLMAKKKGNNYIIDEENGIAKIELNRWNGKENLWAIIDLEDLDRVINFPYTWVAKFNKSIDGYYAAASQYIPELKRARPIHLHQFIMNTTENNVDHINHNPLDDRKSNLRVITVKQNSRYREGKNKNNKLLWKMHGSLQLYLLTLWVKQ